MASTAFIEKEKIRTMKKDILEASGTPAYPKEKTEEEVPMPDFEERISSIEASGGQADVLVEEETKKAEELAEVIAVSAEKGEDITDQKNILENIAPEEKETAPLDLPIEEPHIIEPPTEIPSIDPEEQARIEQMLTPSQETHKEEQPNEIEEKEPVHETPIEPEEEKEENPILELPQLPTEEDIIIPQSLPSAKELGLEEPEPLPSNEILGLEEPEEEKEAEEIITEDPNEIKLREIAEKTFGIEEKLKDIAEEKAPFEKRKAEINEQIDNLKKKLDLILERKKSLDVVKLEMEQKETAAASTEDKRTIEKERWKLEEERNACEKDKDEKEDEIKSLRLQIRECDLNCEKVIAREKDLNQEMQILTKERDRIILGQARESLMKKLRPLEAEIENIKREMFENTKIKDRAEKNLTEIMLKEKSIEDEIKLLEKRQVEAKDEAVVRDIENRRRSAEEKRRSLEKDRWDHEDKVKDVESKRGVIKEKYQEVAFQVRQLKKELLEIEEKIK